MALVGLNRVRERAKLVADGGPVDGIGLSPSRFYQGLTRFIDNEAAMNLALFPRQRYDALPPRAPLSEEVHVWTVRLDPVDWRDGFGPAWLGPTSRSARASVAMAIALGPGVIRHRRAVVVKGQRRATPAFGGSVTGGPTGGVGLPSRSSWPHLPWWCATQTPTISRGVPRCHEKWPWPPAMSFTGPRSRSVLSPARSKHTPRLTSWEPWRS